MTSRTNFHSSFLLHNFPITETFHFSLDKCFPKQGKSPPPLSSPKHIKIIFLQSSQAYEGGTRLNRHGRGRGGLMKELIARPLRRDCQRTRECILVQQNRSSLFCALEVQVMFDPLLDMASAGRSENPSPSSSAPQILSKPSSNDRHRFISQASPSLDITVSRTPTVGAVLRTTSVSVFSSAAEANGSPKSTNRNSVLGPKATDRVFPVRSVVSVDPTATPMPRGESGDEFPGMHATNDCDPKWNNIRVDSSTRNRSPGRQSTLSSRAPTPSRPNSPGATLQSPTLENLRCRRSLDNNAARNNVGHTHHEIN